MEALTNYVTKEGDNQGRLTFKCFSGMPTEVEKQLNDFLCKKPMYIQKILQSESGYGDNYSITITIAYYSEEKPHFLGEHLTVEMLAERINECIKDFWGIKISDIQEAIFSKEMKEISEKQKSKVEKI